MQQDPRSRLRYRALRGRGHSRGRALRGVADRLLAVACGMLEPKNTYAPGIPGMVTAMPESTWSLVGSPPRSSSCHASALTRSRGLSTAVKPQMRRSLALSTAVA